MACEAPIDAYRPATGGPLTFNRPLTGQAGVDYHKFEIPCGYCILCRTEYARQTAIRIYHEAQCHEHNAFCTFTYDEKHLPTDYSLNYDDYSRFLKRLRKRLGGKLRHYSVGEYGDKSMRPHYHACIFGHAFDEGRIILRHKPTLLWTSPMLSDAWGLGHVSVGALNFTTAMYTASYIAKKLRKKQRHVKVDQETGELIPVAQPKAIMSPNLGRQWWDQYRHHVSALDYVIIEGRKHKPPKAYDKWLGEVNEIPLDMIKQTRREHAQPKTEEQNRARARNAHARAKAQNKSV